MPVVFSRIAKLQSLLEPSIVKQVRIVRETPKMYQVQFLPTAGRPAIQMLFKAEWTEVEEAPYHLLPLIGGASVK